MKGKLIKIKDNYRLYAINHLSGPELFEGKLSIKNCQVIENGYDLDELYDELDNSDFLDKYEDSLHYYSFIEGFQKCLELLGGKKYSEEDVMKAFLKGQEMQVDYFSYKQSLQQTEWDVEIETYIFSTMDDKSGFSERRPKLDADGCLMLKRI